jgi:hypothetical protein
MLFLHELHSVVGAADDAFEAAFRDDLAPALARGDDARLLHFLRHAHGSGPSYRVVTVTAIRDGAAWERLVHRVEAGDLAAWARDTDRLRHDVEAKILIPLPWSPLREVDLAAIPASRESAEPRLFMEDTVWPFAERLEDYVARSGSHYAREMARAREEGRSILRVEAAFRTAFGSGRRREVVLWQRVRDPRALVPLLSREVPERYRAPGTWMHDALELRDQWQSRLLRAATWSPAP